MTQLLAWVVPNKLTYYKKMKAETPYIHLHQRKRTWTPVEVSAGQLLTGGEEVIQRALALRCLEIPVGDFISDAMKGDLPDVKGCKELLASNVVDEENHDIALNFAAAAHGVSLNLRKKLLTSVKLGLNSTGTLFSKLWCLKDPCSSFSYRSSDSSEIQASERQAPISAETNRPTWRPTPSYVSRSVLNLTRPSTISDATVAWCLQSLQGESDHKHLSSNFWLASSDSLYTRGKAEGLAETRASRMPAFFETANQNLPQYA